MLKKYKGLIHGLEQVAGQEEIKKGKPDIDYSPEEKAEQLWALWLDYRRRKFELYQEARSAKDKKKTGSVTKTMESIETDDKLVRLKQEISKRWQEAEVQKLFKKHLAENIKEREAIEPTLESYRQRERELASYKEQQQELYRQIFVHRAEEPDELTLIELAEVSSRINTLNGNLNEIFAERPELTTFIMNEKLKQYHVQYEETGYIWLPSRENLYDEILEDLVILNQNRPIFLTGETGTGKTRLARATGQRLTDKRVYEVGEEARNDIRPILGSQSIKAGETYVTYGPLGQALTGKHDSLDRESDGGGIFYWDEMNSYPPDALRSVIKQVSGRKPGDEIAFAAWRGQSEKITDKFGLIGSANLPSEKHPDRPDLPVEVTRELSSIEVSYPEQTKDNPEMFEAMLAVTRDKNGRLRLRENEVAPLWQEKIKGKEKVKELDEDPKAGGTLWRFANLVAEIQKSYVGKEENKLTVTKRDASYLRTAVLDPGIVLAWLREYRVAGQRQGETLKGFLITKLKSWSSQETYPQEDRGLLKEFFKLYNFDIEKESSKKELEKEAGRQKIWSEKEIGFLSPRVPRPKEEVEPAAPPIIVLANGTLLEYKPVSKYVGQEFSYQGSKLIYLGETQAGKIVLKDEMGVGREFETEEFVKARYETNLIKLAEELQNPDILAKEIENLVNELIPKEDRAKVLEKIESLTADKKREFVLEYYRKKFT